MKTVEIPIKKTKIILYIFVSIFFTVLSTLFIIYPDTFVSPFVRDPILIFIAGLVCTPICIVFTFYIVKKLFQTTMGLIINEEGIYDNSAGIPAGMIFWKDIKYIENYKISSQKIIRIIVKNPNDYIERQTSYFKRKLFAINQKHYGSPIQLSEKVLAINFDELYELLQSKFSEYKSHLAQVTAEPKFTPKGD